MIGNYKEKSQRWVNGMKPLQHAQISAKTYGGCWTDYVEVHSFLDSSKAACAHFKHRFLLHHAEGIELGIRVFGASVVNSEMRRSIFSAHRTLTPLINF